MNNQTFNQLLDERITKTRIVLARKADEYASNNDRHHNFRVAARLSSTPITPEEALVGMMRKHWVSVLDIVDGINRGITPSVSLVDEKIGDTINYMILLETLILDRIIEECFRDSESTEGVSSDREQKENWWTDNPAHISESTKALFERWQRSPAEINKIVTPETLERRQQGFSQSYCYSCGKDAHGNLYCADCEAQKGELSGKFDPESFGAITGEAKS